MTNKRSHAWRVVHVFDDDDARGRDGQDVGPPVGPVVIPMAHRRRRRAADARRHRVSNDGRQLVERTPDAAIGESLIAQAALEGLDRVRDRARVEAPKGLDQLGRELAPFWLRVGFERGVDAHQLRAGNGFELAGVTSNEDPVGDRRLTQPGVLGWSGSHQVARTEHAEGIVEDTPR